MFFNKKLSPEERLFVTLFAFGVAGYKRTVTKGKTVLSQIIVMFAWNLIAIFSLTSSITFETESFRLKHYVFGCHGLKVVKKPFEYYAQ